MTIGHAALVGMVVRVNGPLALITWPFTLYEALGKSPHIPELKEKLLLRRDQVLASVALDLGDRLRPFFPRSVGRIIVEGVYESDLPVGLSDDAINAVKVCLDSREPTLHRARTLRKISSRILAMHAACYWLIFSAAIESLAGLIIWFFDGTMSDRAAIILLAAPIATAVVALIFAGLRQAYFHRAHKLIIGDDE